MEHQIFKTLLLGLKEYDIDVDLLLCLADDIAKLKPK